MKKHLAFICLCLTFFASTPTASAEIAQVRLPSSRFYDSIYALEAVLVSEQEEIDTVTAVWTATPFVDVNLVEVGVNKFVSFEVASGNISGLAANSHASMFNCQEDIMGRASSQQQDIVITGTLKNPNINIGDVLGIDPAPAPDKPLTPQEAANAAANAVYNNASKYEDALNDVALKAYNEALEANKTKAEAEKAAKAAVEYYLSETAVQAAIAAYYKAGGYVPDLMFDKDGNLEGQFAHNIAVNSRTIIISYNDDGGQLQLQIYDENGDGSGNEINTVSATATAVATAVNYAKNGGKLTAGDGNSDPGNANPGNANPGNANPGNANPGGVNTAPSGVIPAPSGVNSDPSSVNTAIVGVAGGSGYAPAQNSNWQVYLTPYGASASNRQSNSYGGNMGVNGGINYIFNEKFTLGVYFDLGASRTSAELFDSETNSYYGALGLSASYRITPYWYVRGSLGGAWTHSQLDYVIDSFSGDTSYNTSAFMAELATGYVFKINDNHAITPEVGLSYLYMHTNAYDMNVPDYPIYNMSYDAVSHDALYGTLSLRWDGMFNITDETIFTPHVKVGVRQNLSGHELTADLRIFGEKFTSKSTSDMTTAIVNAGFGFKKNGFSVNIDYNGEYGHDQTSHGGSINFMLEF